MIEDQAADLPTAKPGMKRDVLPAADEQAIRRRFVRTLSIRLPTLVDLVVMSLHTCEPAYRSSVPPAELQMAKSINEVLKTCETPPESRAITTVWPDRVGRRRAQQGIPLDALRRAYHIGGQVFFDAFLAWADEDRLPREHRLLLADDLWHIVDVHRAAAITAFRAAEAELAGGQEAGRKLDSLLSGEGDRDCVASVARAWGLAEHARYAVVVQRPLDWGACPLEPADLPASAAGVRVIWRMQAGGAIGVAVLGDVGASAFAQALRPPTGRRIGVSLAVDNLADVGRARRLAELAARTASTGNAVACLEEKLPAAVVAARPDLARELYTRVLGRVLALDRVSRDLLLDTLAAWLGGGGSAHRAAGILYCHRNTVLNRIRRLEHLTSRSLSSPRDVVELALALQACRLGSAPA